MESLKCSYELSNKFILNILKTLCDYKMSAGLDKIMVFITSNYHWLKGLFFLKEPFNTSVLKSSIHPHFQ